MSYLEFDEYGDADAESRFEQIEESMQSIAEEGSAPIEELLCDDFMAQYTRFGTAKEFFAAGCFDISSLYAFQTIPSDLLNAHVVATTDFGSWKLMLQAAAQRYMLRRFGI